MTNLVAANNLSDVASTAASVGNLGTTLVVNSISALRAVSKITNANVFVSGYYAEGDGGGGAYVYNAASSATDNGGTIIVATDGGRWYLAYTTMPSVKQFGAYGNGSTDDAAAINAALAASSDIYFPAGTYLVQSPITLMNDANLVGAGVDCAIIVRGASIADSEGAIGVDSGSASVQIGPFTIRDLTVQGANSVFMEYLHLISLNGVIDALIFNVKFKQFQGDGLYVGSGYAGGSERHNLNVRVLNCIFDGVNNTNRNGITVTDGDQIVIENNYFTHVTYNGEPGAIDIEPDGYSYSIIKNIIVKNNRFSNIGGSVAVISVQIPAAVTAPPTNIIVEGNSDSGYTGCGAFFNFNTNRIPNATSMENDVKLIGNHGVGGTKPLSIFDGKRILIRDNLFTDYTDGNFLGNAGSTNVVRDIDIIDNRFIRNSSSTATGGLAVFNASYVRFVGNRFIDCGTGTSGNSNAIDFNAGISSYIQFNENEISSPTGKTLVAIQKESSHTFTPATNVFFNNSLNGLPSFFQYVPNEQAVPSYLAEGDSFTPLITGATTPGIGTYTAGEDVGYYTQVGRLVQFRHDHCLDCSYRQRTDLYQSPFDHKQQFAHFYRCFGGSRRL